MSLQDALAIFIIIGIVTFTVCTALVAYFLVKALRALTELTNSMHNKTLSTIPALLLSLVSKLVRKRP